MTIFYWVMGSLVAITALPSLIFFLLYLATGEDGARERAARLFQWTKVFGLTFFNVGIWGHVVVGLYHIWFK
jgi:hypothetical protein